MYFFEISSFCVDIIVTIALVVDKNGDYESNSLLPVVIVVSVIAVVAIIAGVILLILHIKLRAAYKRS